MSKDPKDPRLEIASAVLGELEHFEGNFRVEIHPSDQPRIIVFESQMNLREEPFIAYVRANVDGNEKVFLICRNYTPMDTQPLSANASFVSYKAPFGSIASKRVGEEIGIRTPRGLKIVTVLQKDVFKPKKVGTWDAVENKLSFPHQEFLVDSLRQLIQQITSAVPAGEVDLAEMDYAAALEALDERAEFPPRGVSRIAQIIALRDQPILDEIQDELFRLPLSSQLIVTGAPGTGKTTVLIRRLAQKTKFDLLSEDERKGFSETQATTLFDPNHSWLMFTPNELLKGYLKEALSKELLAASEHTVKTWANTRNILARDVLKILKAGKSGYFSRTDDLILSRRTHEDIVDYTLRFTSFYSDRAWEKTIDAVQGFAQLTLTPDQLRAAREPVFERFDSFLRRLLQVAGGVRANFEKNTQERTLTLFERLSNFRAEFEELRTEVNAVLNRLVGDVIKDRGAMVREIAAQQKDTSGDQAEVRKAALRSIKDALIWFGGRESKPASGVSSTSRSTWETVERSLSLEEKTKFKKVVEPLVQCRRALGMIERSLRGYGSVISAIPNEYIRFRKKLWENQDQALLIQGTKEHIEGQRLSAEEADLLIFVMLRDAKALFKRNRDLLYGATKDDLLEDIKFQYRTQIAVEEATDFSALQLGCMYNLSHPQFDSVSFIGDLMQRVTSDGLRAWEECRFISESFAIKSLSKAYRQSPKLLAIAAKLYRQSVGEEPPFSSPFEIDGLDPQPLVFRSDDRRQTGQWIADRIVEIYELNGFRLPSVAIFVAEDADIDEIYSFIKGPLSENSIEVEKCPEGRILGTDSRVRIFSVEYIKGLEFGAVFFVNVDRIHEKKPALVDKYLYVGLTRATTFLAITCASTLPDSLAITGDDFYEGDWGSLVSVNPTVVH